MAMSLFFSHSEHLHSDIADGMLSLLYYYIITVHHHRNSDREGGTSKRIKGPGRVASRS